MRHRAFPGPRLETRALYERAGKFLLATIFRDDDARAWCKANGIAITRAADETMDSTGGFLVPHELAAAILDLRDMFGAFRRRARIMPMKHDSMGVPRHAGGTSAFFTAQNAAVSGTNANPDSMSLTAKKIGALVQISSELEEDAIDSMVDYVANEIAFAFAAQEDDCAFNGDGTSKYGGMLGVSAIVLDGNHNKAKVTAASGHNTFAGLDTTDLGNVMAAVQASAIPNAAWFCSQTAFALTFCRLAGSGGGGYLDTRLVDGIPTPCYLGFPVVLTQKLPLVTSSLSGKVMLAFGDMYGAGVLGERRGITIARSSHRYFDQDQIGVLGTERFDAVLHQMGDNANFGQLAALVGN